MFVYLCVLCRIAECHNEDTTMECMLSNISDFEGPFGVILFLYSVILTKVSPPLGHTSYSWQLTMMIFVLMCFIMLV